MSGNQRSLEMVNRIIAGGDKPEYDRFNSDGISKSTHKAYCEIAVRIRAYFGASEQPFKSIGQMNLLARLCAGRNRIKLLGKIPQASLMPKGALIGLIEKATPLITESEIVRGALLMPDVSNAENFKQVTNVAKEFIYKLYMLNVTTFAEFELIADSELVTSYETTRSKWGDYLAAEFEPESSLKFLLLVLCMVHENASTKANPKVRAEVITEMGKIENVKRGMHWVVDGAIRSAIQKGRLS